MQTYPHDLLELGLEMHKHRKICYKLDLKRNFYIKFAEIGFESLLKPDDISEEDRKQIMQ